jgi:hypothetical protein
MLSARLKGPFFGISAAEDSNSIRITEGTDGALPRSGSLCDVSARSRQLSALGHGSDCFLPQRGSPSRHWWWCGTSTEKVLALISSTLIFQAAEPIVGLGLGIPPLPVMVLMTSVAIAAMIAIFEASRMIGDRSEK